METRVRIRSGRPAHAGAALIFTIGASVVALAGVAVTPTASSPQPSAPPGPSLVVLLVVDQMRADYVDRYGFQWTAGLRRLFDTGARFSQAAFPYLNTVTCAGHATIGTGSLPRTHGMVLNDWWDRSSGRLTACTADPAAALVSYGEPRSGGESAWRLRVPTLADALRTQLGEPSRVVSLSLKARSAIGMAGRRGDAVTWFDGTAWVTSSAYATAPVPAIQRFVDQHPVARELDRTWDRRLPVDRYLFDDAGVGERPGRGWDTEFPHALADASGKPTLEAHDRWRYSPFSDDYLGRLAEAALDDWKLGQGPGTDMLAISFSALDLVGHWFGPRSHEVQDVLARLDATVGRLLAHLDRTVGEGRYVVALSADHGVAPIPEQMEAEGLPAGRVATRNLSAAIERALDPWFPGEPTVASVRYTEVYLAPGVFDRLRRMPDALAAVLRVAETSPGIARVFTRDVLADPASAGSADRALRAAALGFDAERSGDIALVPRPYWIASSDATTHGTASQYDQRVPLVLLGARIRAGEYLQPASPADIAPTLAHLAGVTLPAADGRVLAEALEPARGPDPEARRR